MTDPREDDTYDDLTRRLSGLAADATYYTSTSSDPLSAESVRRLGGRRRHRRFAGVVAAALAVVVVAGGAAIGANRLAGDELPGPVASPKSAVPSAPTNPTPSSSATPSAAPSTSPSASPSTRPPSTPPSSPTSGGVPTGSNGQSSLDITLLPQPVDLAWVDFGDYRTDSTAQGLGRLPAETCVATLADVDPTAVARRDLTGVHDGVDLDVKTTTWVLRFDATTSTDAALATLRATGGRCGPASRHEVAVARGSAEFYEHTTSDSFVFFGISRVGDTIAVVLMTSVATESYWSYDVTDTTGLQLHPLIRSLPLVNARLAGTPGQVPSSSSPAVACPGGPKGLLVSIFPSTNAAADTMSYRIQVTNTMKVECVITGYPGVQFGDDQGAKTGADATPVGPKRAALTIQPGKSANAVITMAAAADLGTDCKVSTVSTFRIFLPGAKEPTFTYSPGMKACTSATINQLEVTGFQTS